MDRTQQYLNSLTGAYRVEEYQWVTDGAGKTVIIVPFNPNRVLLWLGLNPAFFGFYYFTMPSGLQVPITEIAGQNTIVHFSITKDFALPTLEIRCVNTAIGFGNGFGLIKSQPVEL